MSAWTELRDGIRTIILMQDRFDRLDTGVEKLASALADHDGRLVRIEVLIELARSRQLRNGN